MSKKNGGRMNPVEDALEIYGNQKKYGLPGPKKDDWEDLKLLKEEIVKDLQMI